MAKIHLVIRVKPIIPGEDTEAVCGALVHAAQPIPDDIEEVKSTIIFCKDCFGPKYQCAIVSGEESLHP